MDVRKETLTGMLRTTGSKRVSVIIQDKKGRYLIAEKAGVEEEPIEFPSFSCKDAKLPEGDEGIKLVTEGIKEVIGIEIENPKLIETFFDDEYPFYHYIFRVEKYSGSPVKGYYDRIYWQKLDEIKCEGMSWIALQVYQKVSECAYCLKICDKKPEIDIFIQEYMSHDAGRMVSEILDSPASDNKDAYNMALRYYFSHLRAWLVESPNLKKNRTIQNFLIMYERQDLLDEVNAVLDLQVKESWTVRTLIRDFVDKNIAHYDQMKMETEQIISFCEQIFSKEGRYPLIEFVQDIEFYMMSLVLECWYYAGEMGSMISETTVDFAVFMDVNRQDVLDRMHSKFNP